MTGDKLDTCHFLQTESRGYKMKIELTTAVVECLKRGLNCWPQQNDAEGIEIKEILKQAEKIAEDV